MAYIYWAVLPDARMRGGAGEVKMKRAVEASFAVGGVEAEVDVAEAGEGAA